MQVQPQSFSVAFNHVRTVTYSTVRQVPHGFRAGTASDVLRAIPLFEGPDGMVFEYSSGVREIADELLYRERQLPFDPKGFCEWGAKPQIREFRN